MATEKPAAIHQARWVIPMEGPVIENGAVAAAGDRITAVGPAAEITAAFRSGVHLDHGEGAIIPALVNTHVHLEFTALRGAVPSQTTLAAWLAKAMEAYGSLSTGEIERGVREGVAEMRRLGTVLAAEVSTTGRSWPVLAAAGMECHYFFECLGFDLLAETPLTQEFPFLAEAAAEALPLSAAAHAPYSVSASLFQRIKAWNRGQGRPSSVHLAESREEGQFLQHGTGPFQELLALRGRWYEDYSPPGCSPAVYLDRLGFWDDQSLAVHGVWLEEPDRELLARRGVWLALCPRSNLYTGAGMPDLPALRGAGIKLTLGTDSLASNRDLNLFMEIKVLQERFPEVEISDLLAMATINGAAALGRDRDFGSLEPGKKAALLFLPLAPGASLWPGILESGVQGRAAWLTPTGKESSHGA